jgi:hypothetical protein
MFGQTQAFGLLDGTALDIAWGLRPDWPPEAAWSTRPVSDRFDEVRNAVVSLARLPRGGHNPIEKTNTQ